MKTWVQYTVGVLFVVAFSMCMHLVFSPACTSPINVNVKIRKGNDSYNCTHEVHNSDGSTSFQKCHKSDGQEPTDQKAVDAPDNITGMLFLPSLN